MTSEWTTAHPLGITFAAGQPALTPSYTSRCIAIASSVESRSGRMRSSSLPASYQAMRVPYRAAIFSQKLR